MTKKITLAVITIILAFSNCSIFVSTPSVDTLAESFRQRLTRREFGKIYDDASDHLRMNLSKTEFIERAQKIVVKLEEVEKELAWQDDDSLGRTFEVKKYERNTYLTAFRKVGEETQKIHVLLVWEQEPGDAPRLFDFTAFSHPDAPNPFDLGTTGTIDKVQR